MSPKVRILYGVICYDRWVLSEDHKNNFTDLCLLNSQPTFLFFDINLTQWIMTILSKGSKPDKYESQNSLKLCFTNSHDLHSNFVEWESFLESNSHDIPTLRETNLDDRLHALLPPFLDVTRMSMSIVSFLPQLNSGILCL